MSGEPILSLRNLRVWYGTEGDPVRAVDGVTLEIRSGETLGLVGESGCGKSTLGRGILGLLPDSAAIAGEVRFRDRDLVGIAPNEMRELRGPELGLIFQEPMTRLDPLVTIESHFLEAIEAHEPGLEDREMRRRSLETLAGMGIPPTRFKQYPHEFSGGMRQRIMIALALVLNPKLVIADEPTTALDVIVEAQILGILADLRESFDTALLLITHNLGIVAEFCDSVNVMYAGRLVERAAAENAFSRPVHPYTEALLRSVVRADRLTEGPLPAIPGAPPDLAALPSGCSFEPRCALGRGLELCRVAAPPTVEVGPPGSRTMAECHFANDRWAATYEAAG
jgi:peptide/nickel transport system ATP-binding protein